MLPRSLRVTGIRRRPAPASAPTELAELGDELRSQQDNIATIRQENEDTLDAMAIRIAQMNARMIRLDALGRRLTDMADIDAGEFDFDSEPALGGPEEPISAAIGSNVAVPDVVEAMASLDTQLDSREAQLGVLERVIMSQNLSDRVYPQGRPVSSGWISSYYGRRTDPFTGKPANHTGIDFRGSHGPGNHDRSGRCRHLVGRSFRLRHHGRDQSRQRLCDALRAQFRKSRESR